MGCLNVAGRFFSKKKCPTQAKPYPNNGAAYKKRWSCGKHKDASDSRNTRSTCANSSYRQGTKKACKIDGQSPRTNKQVVICLLGKEKGIHVAKNLKEATTMKLVGLHRGGMRAVVENLEKNGIKLTKKPG